MKSLNKLYYLKLEIDDLRDEIDNIPEINGISLGIKSCKYKLDVLNVLIRSFVVKRKNGGAT